ncbi:MAG: DNA cytosine methyltransferase [Thiohalomonadaceae bacterium]
MKIVSLFSGAGGLDLGFKKAGYNIIWANDNNPSLNTTYTSNHPETIYCSRDIRRLSYTDVPDCDGIIGGPPCQSWSVAGNQKGLEDDRGKMFLEFIRLINEKQPLFFVAENVKGILLPKHQTAYDYIMNKFADSGYNTSTYLLNARDYNVPQNRERVFFIGFKKDTFLSFQIPPKHLPPKNLRQAIGDLEDSAIPAVRKYFTNGDKCVVPNHEYLDIPFPFDYGNYNRVKPWEDQSYTIRATGKYALPHPLCPKMQLNQYKKYSFPKDIQEKCRRLTVRECARIQTFPDQFVFHYQNLMDGYSMVGNAVPVNLSYNVARCIE